MDYKTEKVTIANLVDQFKSGALSRDEEYQRGVEWSLTQQQGLIDSIFRRYPIPPIFLHEKRVKSLRGEESTTYDIVDGQQRLVALRDFRANNFCLLDRSDKKLRIPHSLRQKPAPWGKRWYRDLDNLQAEFDNRTLDVFFIEGAVERDEIRDLFIRLQSGTALTRQQVRDAWPGNVGPFVVALAGKFSSRPKFTGKSSGRSLFQLIDRRGQGVDEDTDQYDFDRQFCAQLLTLFVARERDILSEQGTSANNLDQLYHEETTDFAPGSKTAGI